MPCYHTPAVQRSAAERGRASRAGRLPCADPACTCWTQAAAAGGRFKPCMPPNPWPRHQGAPAAWANTGTGACPARAPPRAAAGASASSSDTCNARQPGRQAAAAAWPHGRLSALACPPWSLDTFGSPAPSYTQRQTAFAALLESTHLHSAHTWQTPCGCATCGVLPGPCRDPAGTLLGPCLEEGVRERQLVHAAQARVGRELGVDVEEHGHVHRLACAARRAGARAQRGAQRAVGPGAALARLAALPFPTLHTRAVAQGAHAMVPAGQGTGSYLRQGRAQLLCTQQARRASGLRRVTSPRLRLAPQTCCGPRARRASRAYACSTEPRHGLARALRPQPAPPCDPSQGQQGPARAREGAPGRSFCSSKQKHWILLKYSPACCGATLYVDTPVTAWSLRLCAV